MRVSGNVKEIIGSWKVIVDESKRKMAIKWMLNCPLKYFPLVGMIRTTRCNYSTQWYFEHRLQKLRVQWERKYSKTMIQTKSWSAECTLHYNNDFITNITPLASHFTTLLTLYSLFSSIISGAGKLFSNWKNIEQDDHSREQIFQTLTAPKWARWVTDCLKNFAFLATGVQMLVYKKRSPPQARVPPK